MTMGKRSHGLTLAHAQQHAAKHGYQLADVPGGSVTVAGETEKSRSGQPGALKSLPKSKKRTKPELEYSLILEAMKRRGDIHDWKFEGITVRLADDFGLRRGRAQNLVAAAARNEGPYSISTHPNRINLPNGSAA